SLRWVLKRGLREGFTASPAVRIAGRSLAACDHCRNLQEHLPGTQFDGMIVRILTRQFKAEKVSTRGS
ncbi:MAG TPA: hypothetical protein VJ756_22260, partial [Terriglobales bacterium]|nr:hypothetical protein [Terriglobales bacterium]